ncbi:coiled-coil domain-containing protein SCD2-like [Hibiscus syriacus]|uniref:coiled-coil domain-containing protein SCD2-like n=1 Tax=Hibiscus syriacus TaxID=106335 RepID=UPI0019238A66|nr:coiled-coil domain-containing protein SCD2-like [Hibiscus syriacus]
MAQRPVQHVGAQPSYEDNDEDDLDNSSVSGKPTIGLGGRARPSSSPLSVRVNQDQTQPTSGQNIVEQSMSPPAGQSSLQSSAALSVGRPSAFDSPSEQPVSPGSTGPGRQQSGVGMLHTVPKTTASVLQDELDMLQDKNECLLQKLHLAEERCEEAEARARLLEKQIADLGEGATLEASLSSRQASGLHMIAALQTEAEIERSETNCVLEKLSKAEFEIKALQTVTKQMMLTEEEMLLIYSLRTSRFAGIQADIACVKYDYWSSFAPLPFEIVLAAGQRAREEDISSNDLEERQKVLKHTNELSEERIVECMLLVEKVLRELELLKVEDAVAFAMAKQRRTNMHKTEVKMPTDGQFEAFELSQEESEDVSFKQAWLTYFWRRALSHGVEPDIADERLQSWINRSSQSSTSQDAVEVERGLMEMRRLGMESQLWKTSRQGLELGATARLHTKTDF